MDHTVLPAITRVAVDMDIHGYMDIHVWISDLGHPVDRSMDIKYVI